MEKVRVLLLAPTGISCSDTGLISFQNMSNVKGSILLIAADALDWKCRQVHHYKYNINTTINILSLWMY